MCRFPQLTALALLAIFVAAYTAAEEDMSLKDDFQALQKPQGLWTRSTGEGKTQLHFQGKEFPKLQVKITELVRGNKDFDRGKSVKVNATLQEKEGKRVLLIEGESIAYSFERNQGFLILKGGFKSEKKIDLTGRWGKTRSDK